MTSPHTEDHPMHPPLSGVLFDALPLGLVLRSLDGTVTALNPAAERMLGLTLPQLQQALSIGSVDHVGTSKASTNWQPVLALLEADRAGQDTVMHYVHPKQHGTSWIKVHATSIRADDGSVIGACLVMEDISAVRQVQTELGLSEERFRHLFEKAPVGVSLLDPRSGFMLDANARFADILGRAREQILGCTWMSLMHPDDVADNSLAITSLLDGQSGLSRMDKRCLRPDGSVVWVHMTLSPITVSAGHSSNFLMTIEDITERKTQEESLRSVNDRLSFAELAANAGSWDWNFSTRHMTWSIGLFHLFGLDPKMDDGTNKWWRTTIPSTVLPQIESGVAQAVALREQLFVQSAITLADGRVQWIEIYGNPSYDAQGQPTRLTGICIDVTRRKASEQKFIESEERFRQLFEETRLPSVLVEKGRFIAVNQACLDLFHLQHKEQILGLTPIDVSPPFQPDGRSSAEKATETILIALTQGSNAFEWECVRTDGEHFFIQLLLTAIDQGDRKILHAVFSDITEEKKAREHIKYLAYHDPLTDLPNRLAGQEQLQQALARAKDHHVALFYLDLDRFKLVNDTHGHTVGDDLLRQVGQRLAQCVRSGDTLCRLSGDEFMIVLSEVQTSNQLIAACNRIHQHFTKQFELGSIQLVTSFSIGVAQYPQDGQDSETLMRHADTALFEAKKLGPGSHLFFEEHMNARLLHYVETCDALRLAIQRHEFELHYQPQIDLHNGKVVGAEALIRWHRPGHGLVQPSDFIAIAEESGLIVPIGCWVLQEACRQAMDWQTSGVAGSLVVAVNLSAVQFRQDRATQDVTSALEQSGLDPKRLELELTESIMLQNEDQIMATIARWKARGIRMSIDDFGTGYSSLAYLTRFNVDKLKIDRSFVTNMRHSEQDLAIVKAIIQVAQSLQLRTIAEGIEDASIALQLKELGCDELQGYLYAPPMPAVDFIRWLLAHQDTLATRASSDS